MFVKHEMSQPVWSSCGPPTPEPTCCLSVPTTGPGPCRSGVQRRRGAVCRLRGSHRRPLPAARERALLARDLRQVRGVFKCADRDLLLQGPPAVLQARLWEVREHTTWHIYGTTCQLQCFHLQQQQQQQQTWLRIPRTCICLQFIWKWASNSPHPNSQISLQNMEIFHSE